MLEFTNGKNNGKNNGKKGKKRKKKDTPIQIAVFQSEKSFGTYCSPLLSDYDPSCHACLLRTKNLTTRPRSTFHHHPSPALQ